jgi:hypothetical protein
MGFDLEAARITALPEDAFYISDFITEDEEDRLLQKVSASDYLMSMCSLKPCLERLMLNTGRIYLLAISFLFSHRCIHRRCMSLIHVQTSLTATIHR